MLAAPTLNALRVDGLGAAAVAAPTLSAWRVDGIGAATVMAVRRGMEASASALLN